MRLHVFFGGLVVWVLVASAGHVLSQSLPQWSPEDQARLKKGELIVGAAILVDDVSEGSEESAGEKVADVVPPAPDLESSPEVIDVLEQDPENDEKLTNQKLIPDEYLDDYFAQAPASYLIDPQRLFSNQETLDREGFLVYCADESEIDVRIYLFSADQVVPPLYSLKTLVDDRYADGPLTAVVYYFLGNPGRNELMFGGKGAGLVKAERLRKMLDVAKIKAMEKSDSAAQMESFIVQLSISTYWVEQMMASALAEQSAQAMAASSENKGGAVASSPGIWASIEPYFLYALVGILSVFAVIGATVGGWVIWRRSRRYSFPVLDLPVRLGANHAAGIGAVMGFHNKLDSPASQRDQIPDFLTRI